MEIINISETGLDQAVFYAKKILNNQGIIIHPTDTIYGIAGNILEESVYHSIVDIKQRDLSKAISWQVRSVAQLQELVDIRLLPDEFRLKEFCQAVFPGAITIVLPVETAKLPPHLHHLSTIGFRIPDHPFCLRLAASLPFPLTTTSANISNEPYEANINKIIETFNTSISHIFTEQKTGLAKPSTVVGIDTKGIRLIREGSVPFVQLKKRFNNDI